MNFKDLHKKEKPIIICNVWDVESAKIAEQLKYKAIGTSSAAIASILGYNDGEEISFNELEYIVGRITKSTNIPLTVDLEAGYSRDASQIVDNIKRLSQLGVVGINIEDSIVNTERKLLEANEFSKTLEKICSGLTQQNLDIFINVRTDTYLLGIDNRFKETILRAKLYSNAGAQGIFVPCIENEEEIKRLIEKIDIPLNVMFMPNLPNFDVLTKIGVKRISMGNFVHNKMLNILKQELGQIIQNNSAVKIFN